MATIFVLDRELGFMWAFAEALQKHGIAAIPSTSVKEAMAILSAIEPQLRLLWIDCRLPKICEFVEQMRERYPAVKVIGVLSRRRQCRACASQLSATISDAEDHRPERVEFCADLVRSLLRTASTA